ncbi:MAG: PQQ-binding-like beta-propeller repeat protein [Pseudobdellovibrio sp.]
MIKKGLILSLVFLSISCQHFRSDKASTLEALSEKLSVKETDLKVNPFWVVDTLKKENVGFRKVNRFSPVLYKDLIVVGNGLEGLVAYDLYEKNVVWSIDIDQGVEAAGTVINSRLFVGGLNGIFYSIDLDTAKIIWQFDTKSEIVSEPLIQDGLVYFISGANILYCLDATTGRQIWVYNRQDTSTLMTVRGGSKPSHSEGKIYEGFSDGSLVSLDAKTGTPQWEVLLNRNTKFKDIDASPVIDGDTLYINSYDDKLYAVSKSTGSILWKSNFGGSNAPLLFGDKLVYTTSRGQLMVVNKSNGEMIWKVENLKGIATEPIVHKGLIAIGESQGRILFFDALTGQQRGAFDPGRGILSRPTSDKIKRVYFISGEANLYGISLDTIYENVNFPFLQ